MTRRKKKRRINKLRLFIVVLLFLIIIFLIFGGIYLLINIKEERKLDENYINSINTLDYSEAKEFDFDINSNYYMLIRLNDFKVLYEKGKDEIIYPASLTKVVAMNAFVNSVSNLNDFSSLTPEQMNELINENASIAYLRTNHDYSLKDLLFALILPSGADGAKALENYASSHNIDLINKMNEIVSTLNLNNTHFTNTTGLHDDYLYTSLSDYVNLFINTLLNKDAKNVLKVLSYQNNDETYVSTLDTLKDISNVKVLGGKTGYTGQAGECIAVLYEVNNRSYLLLLAGAYGGRGLHYQDVNKIMDKLYN